MGIWGRMLSCAIGTNILSSGTCPAADVDLPKVDTVCFKVCRHDSGPVCSSPDVAGFVDHCPMDLEVGAGVGLNSVADERTLDAAAMYGVDRESVEDLEDRIGADLSENVEVVDGVTGVDIGA